VTESTPEAPKKNAPWYVKAFVALHIFCVTVWALPNPPEGIASGAANPVGSDYILIYNQKYLKNFKPIPAYLFITGTWQYWDMFAPNPASMDIWVDAEVIYRDGSKKHYQYPRIFLLSIPEKYPSERFRKFYERVNDNNYSYLWPPFALRIAYLNDNVANPPVKVRLTRHWMTVSPPGKPPAPNYQSFMYYEYAVDQKKLARMRQGL
jgi:hypothetical protein